MSDELIYRVKFEADDKSLAEVKRQANEAQQKPSSKESGDTSSKEKETSVLKKLRKQLASYREELAKVNQLTAQSSGASIELRDAQINLGSAIRGTSAQIQEATRGYVDQASAINTLPQTYNQLVEQNRALSIAMRDVPLADTTGKLDKLKKQYGENNAKLKEFDKSMGNFQRNVGDYDNSLRSFANTIAVIQGPLGPLSGRINSLATAISRYKQMTDSATIGTGRFQKALIALQGTPIVLMIVALVTAVVSMIQMFKRSEEGQNSFAVRMAKIGHVASLVKDTFADLGKFLVNVLTLDFKEAGQALSDMTDTMLRFLSIRTELNMAGQIAEEFNRIRMAEREMNVERSEMNTKLQEARDIARDETRSIKERRDALAIVRKEEEDFARRKLQLAEDALANEQRQADATKSDIAQNDELAKKQIEVNEARASFFEISMRLRRDDNALMRKLIDQDAAIARSEYNTRQKRRQADLDAIMTFMEMEYNKRGALQLKLDSIEDDRANRIKRREQELLRVMIDKPAQARILAEKEVNAEIYAQTRAVLTEISQLEEQVIKQMAQFDRDTIRHNNQMIFDDTINGYRESYDKIGEIGFRLMALDMNRKEDFEERKLELMEQGYGKDAAENQANLELNQKYNKIRLDLQEELTQTRKDQLDTIKKLEFDYLQELSEQERQEIFKRNERTKGIVFAAEQDLKLLKENLAQTREERIAQLELQYLKSTGDAKIANELATNQIILEDRQALADASQDILDKQLDGYVNTLRVVANALGAFNSAFFEDSKQLAIAQTIVNTLAAAIAAFKDTPGGIFIRALAAAAATATGIANIKKIQQTKLGDKSVSSATPSQPNITTGFGLVDVGTNAPIAEQVAMGASPSRQSMNPTFVFQGDLDPEIMAIKVSQGRNSISGNTIGIG